MKMNWLDCIRQSERLAVAAKSAARSGDVPHSKALYAEAAKYNEQALNLTDHSKPRTLGIEAIGTVALYCLAGQLEEASRVAFQCMGYKEFPQFAVAEIFDMLGDIHPNKEVRRWKPKKR